MQYILLGAIIKLNNTAAIKKPNPNRRPSSRIDTPTKKEEAANKNKVLNSNIPLNITKITVNANKSPKKAILFAFTYMKSNLLPYIHTNCLHTTNHNIDYQYHNFCYYHSYNCWFDIFDFSIVVDLKSLYIHDYQVPC